MRRTFLLVVGLAFAVSACVGPYEAFGWSFTGLNGSGKKATENRSVAAFSAIQVDGSVDVEARVGEPPSVVLEGDDNLLSNITTEVRGGTLVIGTDKSYSTRIGLRARIVAPRLDGISINGSGDASLEGFRADAFRASVAGSGNIDARGTASDVEVTVRGSGDVSLSGLAARKVAVEVHGSGNVRLAGSSDEIGVRVHGSGDVTASDLKARAGSVRIHGSGNVQLSVTESLDAQTNGSGDVLYSGNPPNVRAVENGSGEIRKR